MNTTCSKGAAIQLAALQLYGAKDAPFLNASAIHEGAIQLLAPYDGCGFVGWAIELIRRGKTSAAIRALQVAHSKLEARK